MPSAAKPKRVAMGLGTVQLGVPYGNKRAEALMPEEAAAEILLHAASHGITFFDTAMAYGESEARIGRSSVLAKFPHVEISTKVPVVAPEVWSNGDAYYQFLTSAVAESRRRLAVSQLGLLQFHQCDLPFLEAPSVAVAFQRMIDEGHCRCVGVSVYEPTQASAALAIPAVTALQVPVSILDRRFIEGPLQAQCAAKSAFLIARTVLLQGVLVSEAALPPVKKVKELKELKGMLKEASEAVPVLELALRFIFGNVSSLIDIALIGVDSLASLKQNLAQIDASRDPVSAGVLTRFEAAREFAERRGLLSPASWND